MPRPNTKAWVAGFIITEGKERDVGKQQVVPPKGEDDPVDRDACHRAWDRTSVPGTDRVKGENQFLQVVL